MKKKELSIEDLPGVGAATAEKLKDAGYESLMSLAVSTPGELIEATGMGDSAAKKVISAARNNLDMGFSSGDELLLKREKVKRISTGCKDFDDLVGGGFESGGIAECYGAFGSGKSALAHQLAINAMDIDEEGKPHAYTVWIDSENTFRPERIKQIAESAGFDPINILKHIKIVRAYNSDHQMMCAEKVEDLITKEGLKVNLVIVDSLMTHFRSEFCITPDMEVIGNPTVKKVSNFKEGDKILTHKGRFSKVLNIHKENYKDKIVKISPTYMTPFTLTPDHTVLALKSIRNSWYKNKSKYKLRDENNYHRIVKGNKYYKVYEGYGPDWIMAGTLEKGDFLAYPIIKEVKDINSILITDYLKSKYYITENKIKVNKFFHNIEIYETVLQEYYKKPIRGTMKEISEKYSIPISTIYQWTKGQQKPIEMVELNMDVPITEDSMRLFGYYLAEGHVNDHQVIFTFNQNEISYIDDVKDLMKKIFNLKANKGYIGEGAHRIVFSHKILAEFFGNIFGKGSLNKHMPQWMLFLPSEKQKEIIRGHWRGDGTTSYDGFRFDTTSRLLAEQVKQILLRLKILPCFRIDNNGRENPKYVIEVFGKQIEEFGELMNTEKHKAIERRTHTYNRGWIDNNYAFFPIQNIGEMNYEGEIYNLEIENDSSYALNSVVVHNCGRGTLADRQQKLNKHMHVLMKLADVQNLCVYVTNQVMAKPDTFFGDPTAAIGGNIVGHNSQTRVYLRRGKKGTRVAKLVDSPHLPDGECCFNITDMGIVDVK